MCDATVLSKKGNNLEREGLVSGDPNPARVTNYFAGSESLRTDVQRAIRAGNPPLFGLISNPVSCFHFLER